MEVGPLARYALNFDRLPPDLLIRFLSDHASARECLRVMTSTPLAAMTREVLRSRARWLRPAST